MKSDATIQKFTLAATLISSLFPTGLTFASDRIKGQVLGGGAPIAKSTVTLWEASADAPKQLDQAKTNDDGRFEVRSKGAHSDDHPLSGGNRRRTQSRQSERRQSRHRAADGGGQQAPG